MARPVLLFDGDCGFCQTSARFATKRAGVVQVVAFQQADLGALGVTLEECAETLQYVDEAGRISRGHRAVAAFLRDSRIWWRGLRLFLLLPGLQWFWAAAYRAVARNRYRLPGGTAACAAPTDPPGSPAAPH